MGGTHGTNGNGDHRPLGPITDSAEVVNDRLESLRAALHHAIDQFEDLARRRLGEVQQPVSDAAVERRLRDLEAARGQFRAEVDRWERARRAQVEALEQDRIDLAAVWQKVEEEQTANAAVVRNPAHPRLTHPALPGSAVAPARRAKTSSAGESPMTEQVLEQFQVLRRDVRRKAEGRPPG